jgi:hypothetical protein
MTELAEPIAEAARPGRRRSAVRWWVLAVVFALGFGHAALYAVAFPPWAVEDEQQHVDYVWKLAHDHRLPSIDDEIDYGIIEGIFGTDRFEAYGMARPDPTAESMGLQARSYAAYHPPAAYVALTPVVLATGERALLALYLLRVASALAAGAVAVLTALLAVDVARMLRSRPTEDQRWTAVALAAGIGIALLPALADSGGRVDTDIYATLIVVIGCRAAIRWAERPDNRTSWALGIVLAIAVLTRETALVLAIPVIVATAHLVKFKRLEGATVARALALPLVASTAWITYQWRQSGYLDGSRSFLDSYGAILTQPAPRPVLETVGDSILVPFGTWGVPWPAVVLIAALAVAGLVRLARADGVVPAATAAAMLAFVVLALSLAIGRGLNVASARLLLPAYPAVIAAATVGWASGRSRAATFTLAIAIAAFGAWFAIFELLARFSPRIG